jgi:hypothetical protein
MSLLSKLFGNKEEKLSDLYDESARKLVEISGLKLSDERLFKAAIYLMFVQCAILIHMGMKENIEVTSVTDKFYTSCRKYCEKFGDMALTEMCSDSNDFGRILSLFMKNPDFKATGVVNGKVSFKVYYDEFFIPIVYKTCEMTNGPMGIYGGAGVTFLECMRGVGNSREGFMEAISYITEINGRFIKAG